MKKSAVITQSNYIPWKGYFDQIRSCDYFMLYDCVQYTRRDWRNRNQIKTPQGPKWLTIPVNVKGKFNAPINAMEVADHEWAEQHWNMIRHNYRQAPCFSELENFFCNLYELAAKETLLSKVNYLFLSEICRKIGITTPFYFSEDYELKDDKNERLVSLCKQLQVTNYISGPAAKDYLDVGAFDNEGISVEWFNYGTYPDYPQQHGPFTHAVSIIDLMMAVGDQTLSFIENKVVEPQQLAV
ncbi:MAG: WbqC family protein [Bdellovibrionales bacterium]|nr:WbqC family protein [Bdellovibrionales bacterium]